jgi:hypothetical protein
VLTSRKYKNGAVGNFTHAVALQGTAYACELEIWADGYHMRLVDPYQQPTLYVRYVPSLLYLVVTADNIDDLEMITRRGTLSLYVLLSFYPNRADRQDDDPFFSEVSAFIDAIEGGPDPHILSSFEDATKTYEYVHTLQHIPRLCADEQTHLGYPTRCRSFPSSPSQGLGQSRCPNMERKRDSRMGLN